MRVLLPKAGTSTTVLVDVHDELGCREAALREYIHGEELYPCLVTCLREVGALVLEGNSSTAQRSTQTRPLIYTGGMGRVQGILRGAIESRNELEGGGAIGGQFQAVVYVGAAHCESPAAVARLLQEARTTVRRCRNARILYHMYSMSSGNV